MTVEALVYFWVDVTTVFVFGVFFVSSLLGTVASKVSMRNRLSSGVLLLWLSSLFFANVPWSLLIFNATTCAVSAFGMFAERGSRQCNCFGDLSLHFERHIKALRRLLVCVSGINLLLSTAAFPHKAQLDFLSAASGLCVTLVCALVLAHRSTHNKSISAIPNANSSIGIGSTHLTHKSLSALILTDPSGNQVQNTLLTCKNEAIDLLFYNSGIPSCPDLIEKLAAIAPASAKIRDLVIVSRSSEKEPFTPFYNAVDPGGSLAEALGIRVFPTLVSLRREGEIYVPVIDEGVVPCLMKLIGLEKYFQSKRR